MSAFRVGITSAVFCLVATNALVLAVPEGKDGTTEFDRLLKRHHQDISRPEGKAYEKAFMTQYEAKYGTVLGDCIQKSGQPTSFEVILAVDEEGRVNKGVAKPRSLLTDCVIKATQKDAFPKPPFSPFHIDIEQAFEQ